MDNERELKTAQENNLFDLLALKYTPADERDKVLDNQIARAESGMTVEEIAHVKERVERVVGKVIR